MERKASPELRNVLLVDDDPISLQIISILLSSEHYSVTEADSGDAALSVLRSLADGARRDLPTPDLLLVDMQMPGMDGAALARSVRQLPPPRPRLIAMSATRPAAVPPPGFDSFLLKPIEPAMLHAVLSAIRPPAPHQAAVSDESVLDERVVSKLRAIMPPAALREIYISYVTDTRSRIAELESCAQRGDMDGLRRCAHMIKGSAAMAGVSGIVGIASALEAGVVASENHVNLFQHLRIACDDVEQAFAYTSPERTR